VGIGKKGAKVPQPFRMRAAFIAKIDFLFPELPSKQEIERRREVVPLRGKDL